MAEDEEISTGLAVGVTLVVGIALMFLAAPLLAQAYTVGEPLLASMSRVSIAAQDQLPFLFIFTVAGFLFVLLLVGPLALHLATKLLGFEKVSFLRAVMVVVATVVVGGIVGFIVALTPVVGAVLSFAAGLVVALFMITRFYEVGWVKAFSAWIVQQVIVVGIFILMAVFLAVIYYLLVAAAGPQIPVNVSGGGLIG